MLMWYCAYVLWTQELNISIMTCIIIMCTPVAQLVQELRYKPVGRWYDSRWGHWDFSASNRNEYLGCGMYSGGKGGRYVGLTTLPASCADCLEILGA
jgi:hypothetical protein